MIWRWLKTKQENEIFPSLHDSFGEQIKSDDTDDFFNDAFAEFPTSTEEPNRSFVGSVINIKRFYAAAMIAVVTLLVFVSKTSALQIFNGAEYRLLAENNRIRERVLPAQRGIIYDRNGEILAKNEPTFQVITSTNQLPAEKDDRDALLKKFANAFNLSLEELLEKIITVEEDKAAILLVENFEYEKAMQLAAWQNEFPGLDLELGSRRSYITSEIPSLSHLLGYTGIVNMEEYEANKKNGYRRIDQIGKQGLENSYELLLRGRFGEEILEVDALGNTERIVAKTDPVDGENIYLSIDAKLQKFIETSLMEHFEESNASKAAVIVMEPMSGEILAMVSWPSFDANDFTLGIDKKTYQELISNEDLPLFPRAFAGEYPSGSTIKPVFASAALMEGIIDDQTTFLSTGGLRIGVWFFPDWRAGGHGVTDVYHAIADSVNTFFYTIGGGYESFTGLGVEKLMSYADKFGFGKKSGLDIPGEANGFLPSKEWKEQTKNEAWYIGDTYHVSIGQGDFLVTPLQISRSTATFANGGSLVTPHLAQNAKIRSENIVPDDTVKIIQEAMHRTVTYGSAKSLSTLPVSTAGKTGTAQWSTTKPNHAWFTGYAPFENPEITVTVLVEEGDEGYLAVPIAKEIFNYWFTRIK
ncbi:MAG: penicillin-binding protein 2 [Patescibacteria group bacterium]